MAVDLNKILHERQWLDCGVVIVGTLLFPSCSGGIEILLMLWLYLTNDVGWVATSWIGISLTSRCLLIVHDDLDPQRMHCFLYGRPQD